MAIDYARAASRLGVEVPAVKAIAEVESSGGFWVIEGVVLPVIRLEAHWFGKLTGYQFNNTHPHISCYQWTPSLAGRNETEAWQQFNEASELDPHAAIRSTSWGAFQIMGFHYKTLGYATPQDFRADMATDQGQLDVFLKFIELDSRLHDALRRKDWSEFAGIYNGWGQVDSYSARMETAYQKHFGDGAPVLPQEPRLLYRGCSDGPDVEVLQRALHGYYQGRIDGNFGPMTERAVKAFQRAVVLEEDGKVGKDTRKALGI